MTRPFCQQCHYPLSACVCAAITPMECQSRLIVLQHPSEVNHAKNSVRLMQLVIPQLEVVIGETAEDFSELRSSLQDIQSTYLVYPSDNSQSISHSKPKPASTFIFIDGTWRKAYKMMRLNPWLTAFPAIHLELESESNYRIRKSSRSDSLSTLEAAAMTLSEAEPFVDVTPLHNALNAMVEQRLLAMPAEVQARYR